MTFTLLQMWAGARHCAIDGSTRCDCCEVPAGIVIGRNREFDRRRLRVCEQRMFVVTQTALSQSLQQVA